MYPKFAFMPSRYEAIFLLRQQVETIIDAAQDQGSWHLTEITFAVSEQRYTGHPRC